MRARMLSDALKELGSAISASVPQTNIVQVQVGLTGRSSHDWVEALGAEGVLTRPWGDATLRCVTHRHIDERDIGRATAAFRRVLRQWH